MTQDSSGTVTVNNSSGTKVTVLDSTEDPYTVSVQGFHRAIRSGSRPTVSGLEGLLALQVALAAQESAVTGRAIRIAPPLPNF